MNSDKYWKSYTEIESRIIEISRNIEFDDLNFNNNVHSVVIANLILQCAANIESIAKDIYLNNFANTGEVRNKLHYDYDCVVRIIDEWQLKERIVICCLVPDGCSENNRIYEPFNNHKKMKEWSNIKVPVWDWNEAYQAIKHDYVNSIPHNATLHNLIEIAATFYILILYYEDINIYPDVRLTGYWIDTSGTHLDCKLFSPLIYDFDAKKSMDKNKCIAIFEEGDFVKDGWKVPQRLIMNKGHENVDKAK